MTEAVAQGAKGNDAYVPFYIAIGDYFEAAMERLHTQDIRMGDMLRDKADLDDPDNLQAMAELEDAVAQERTGPSSACHQRSLDNG